jgi:hypothetical protein
MSFTNYTENAVLGHIFGSTTFTKPANRFVALFTAAPGETGGGTEATGGSYARLAAGNFTVSGTAPTAATNGAALEFATATASWGTITHVGIFDASTGGNLLAYAALTTSRAVASGDVFRFPAGDLTFTLE